MYIKTTGITFTCCTHTFYVHFPRDIDALEPSSGMLEVLKGRNIYKMLHQHAIGFKQVEDIQKGRWGHNKETKHFEKDG